jgi:hypothetical protein
MGGFCPAALGTQNVHSLLPCGDGEEMDKPKRQRVWPHGRNEVMKISPEPLHPMRSWRDLWQTAPAVGESGGREQAASQTDHWKQQKRARFNWFNHLFHRGSSR